MSIDDENIIFEDDDEMYEDVYFTSVSKAEELFSDLLVAGYFGKYNRDFEEDHYDQIKNFLLSLTDSELLNAKHALKIILTIETLSSQDILNLLALNFTDLETIHTFKENLIIDGTLQALLSNHNINQTIPPTTSYGDKKNVVKTLEIAVNTPGLTNAFYEQLIRIILKTSNSKLNQSAALKKRETLNPKIIAMTALPQHYDVLNNDCLQQLNQYLSLKEFAVFSTASRSSYSLFRKVLDNTTALNAVVQGRPDELAIIVRNNPDSLFDCGNVTDPAGQIYYDVSPYQLMTFLCDSLMKRQIMDEIQPLMTEKLKIRRKNQYKLIDVGGADLIKTNKKPSFFADENEFSVTQKNMRQQFSHTNNADRYSVSVKYFYELENPDGIIYYKTLTGTVELYYVNRITQQLELIDLQYISAKAQENIFAMFSNMEMNSSRRSSDKEHSDIFNTLNYKLIRKGIQYERNGVKYRDSRIEFELIDAYQKHIKLASTTGTPGNQQQNAWKAVGQAQRKVIWLLQRFYEPTLTLNYEPSIDFMNPFSDQERALVNLINPNRIIPSDILLPNNHLNDGLGKTFALWKIRGNISQLRSSPYLTAHYYHVLSSINLLISNAKRDVEELDEIIAPNAVLSTAPETTATNMQATFI